MKFKVIQSNFAKALNQVSRVVGSRTTLPVLSNVLVIAEKGKIKLAATDLEVAITTQTMGKIEEEGSLTVPSRLLSEFILNNNDESIEFVSVENSLKLKSDRYEANINGISAEEFPTIPLLPKELFCSIKKEDFINAIKKVIIAPANDETRPVLAGIYFKFEGKELTLASTDSYRLCEKKVELEKSVEEKKFIVPARTMSEVLRLVSGAEDAKDVSISSTDNQVQFKIGETEVVSRLIEGAFPNYSQIVPTDSKVKVSAKYADFSSAIKMTALFARNSANNIRIKVSKEELSISTMASETGDAKSKVPAEVSGGELEIAFNVKYISDVLPVIQSDKILLEFNDSSTAGLIKSDQDPNFIYIIMPLKLDN